MSVTEEARAAVESWLAAFEGALSGGDEAALAALFEPDCHWRDVLALTWDYTTVSGRDSVVAGLAARALGTRPRGFALAEGRTPPRSAMRAGRTATEAIFSFETDEGRGSGVVRLDAGEDGRPKAWTLLTTLDEIKGHEERIGRARPKGQAEARDFSGPNWLDKRRAAAAYADHDPAVLIVGGGQAGLAIAARLRQLGLDALIVDREARVGDNWRRRYHALTLHNQVQVNHLPYMPFPPSWPTYIPKDMLANWFEAYVEALELNFWTETEFEGGSWDERAEQWTVTLRRADGSRRTMRPRHVILATGVSGIPNLPDIPTLDRFAGTIMHSGRYEDGEAFAGRNAIVIGTGNSAHDVAQDLASSGATVTMVQRSPTLVVNVEPSAQLAYALYDEGPPLEDCDLIATSMSTPLARVAHRRLTERSRELDKDLLAGLEAKGFRLDFGEDGTGWQFKYLTRGGGYYFNVGCSDLIAKGDVGLIQHGDIAEFTPDGLRLKDGRTIPADLVVLGTGYKGQEELVAKLFGEETARRVGPIWGFGAGEELRNMYVRTPQPGLWFIAGSLAQCRINSKFLALQIKAIEEGLLPASRDEPVRELEMA
ncbi:flavin-containing monooxygenase [Enterovirga rhinocerotis]|uniref:Putative flavoprotein involved in K+ transport n=1 Tax=Enterovirga rhinocerotis TaxID=1339210 RepID=A0A4R7C7I0_9HYPH|nr:NAD(P)/FAD-dependent oxidoreductase [Enterovirga rhinocerotis]TDR93205.1 putative flavoprotein involved in K+ transport [Enterovirga rhinocerotis]